jgi:intracellular septation protein A
MSKFVALARSVVSEIAPLLVFWALALSVGVKPAITGSIAVIVLVSAYKLYRRQSFTRLYLVVSTLTLAFGAVDLYGATPFLLAYEAPISNALTGAAFVVGAFGAKPMLQELAEKRPGADIPQTAETRRFFQLFTLVWAAYFFIKAAGFLWIAATLPLTEALALRSLVGSLSLAAMIALSVTQGRRLFLLFRRAGWLGANAAVASGTQ